MDFSLDGSGIWNAKVVGVMGDMLPGQEESVGKDTTLAVDLAKSVFRVANSTDWSDAEANAGSGVVLPSSEAWSSETRGPSPDAEGQAAPANA
jgi:hypothetical protein